MTTQERKDNLISKIMEIENDAFLALLEDLLTRPDEDNIFLQALPSQRLSIEELIRKHHIKPATPEEIDEIIKQADIQEPLEDLLKMLND